METYFVNTINSVENISGERCVSQMAYVSETVGSVVAGKFNSKSDAEKLADLINDEVIYHDNLNVFVDNGKIEVTLDCRNNSFYSGLIAAGYKE